MNFPSTSLHRLPSDTVDNLALFAEAKLTEFLNPVAITLPPSARAASYHMAAGGHRVRLRLALSACLALQVNANDAVAVATSVELLHNASLVHDDLQDRDQDRRGQKSVWASFGDNIAICAGDLLLSSAYAALATFSRPELLPALFAVTHARIALAIAGQCADLQITDTVSVASYEQIAVAKSGALLGLPLELALIASGASEWQPQARLAAHSFAIGYQIIDDIDDIERDANKGGPAAALNILLVLKTTGDNDQALSNARGMALRHLSKAAKAAELLPMRSGGLMRELALRLSARI